jgi:hypothetical protein
MTKPSNKEAYPVDVAIPNSHNLHSNITERLQMCTDLKEGPIRIWQLEMAFRGPKPLVLITTGFIPNKLNRN